MLVVSLHDWTIQNLNLLGRNIYIFLYKQIKFLRNHSIDVKIWDNWNINIYKWVTVYSTFIYTMRLILILRVMLFKTLLYTFYIYWRCSKVKHCINRNNCIIILIFELCYSVWQHFSFFQALGPKPVLSSSHNRTHIPSLSWRNQPVLPTCSLWMYVCVCVYNALLLLIQPRQSK